MGYYFPNVDPLYLYKRQGTTEDPFIPLQQDLTVKYTRVTLKEIPDFTTKVTVTDPNNITLTEVTTDTLQEQQYRVDYSTGNVYFHTSAENTKMHFSYLGTGYVNVGANRLIIDTSDTNGESLTVQDVLDEQGNINERLTQANQDMQDIENQIQQNHIITEQEIGDLDTLQTTAKDTIVNAINENVGKIGILSDLQTQSKDSLVSAVNENVAQLVENKSDLSARGINVRSPFGTSLTPAKGDGVVDDTIAIQSALDYVNSLGGGIVVIPTGTYLVGGLVIHSNTRLIGIGKAVLKYKEGAGYISPFGAVMITNENLPDYKKPDATDRQYLYNLANYITIENITLDMQNSTTCGGIQLICVDYANVKDVYIKNGREALDLRAIRYSTFTRVYADNIREDVISVTDQNFAAPTGNVHHGISQYLLFDTCWVTNSCFTNGNSQTASMNAFEMDDGMQYVTFRDCVAMNNNGSGFDIHVHTSEYDMEDISFINCKSINNVPVPGTTASVAQVNGFTIGQCPEGSSFKNIIYENCVSIGSPTAFKNSPGAQTGYKDSVSIIGGHWENSYIVDGSIHTDNAVISLMKQFRSFKIIGANIIGSQDSYAFYSYGTGDGLKISDVTIKSCYIPLGLTHTGGRVEINNLSFMVTNPSQNLSSICLVVECDDVSINGLMGSLDQSKYSSSIFRFIQSKKISLTGLFLENIGTIGGNAIQLDTVGYATLTGNIIKNFTNGIYFSNTSTSVISVGNSFKTCTNKYNSTPSYLVDAGNAI